MFDKNSLRIAHKARLKRQTNLAGTRAVLKAKKLILLTDVMGLMKDPQDESTLISKLKVSQASVYEREGIIKGGMIPKVQCAVEAVRRGVETVNIQDGRIPHSILIELLSDEGIGTMFY